MDTTLVNDQFDLHTDLPRISIQNQKSLYPSETINEEMETSQTSNNAINNFQHISAESTMKQLKVRKEPNDSDDDEYLHPKRPLRFYSANKIAKSMVKTSIPTNNKFQVLATASSMASNSDSIDVVKTTETNSLNVNSNPQMSTTSNSVQSKTKKPPPIVLTTKLPNFFSENQKFRTNLQGNLRIVYSNEGIKYLCDNDKDYNRLVDIFSANKYEFYSFTSTNNRPIRVLIKNLPPNITEAEISDELKSLNFPVLNVQQWIQNKNDENYSYRLPIFQITLENNPKSREILQLNSINNIIIKVEAYNPQPRLRQCHNCQSFGHVFSGCKREPRCLKCGDKHLIAHCPFKGPDYTPKCANCQGEHTSNYRECPVFKKHIDLFNMRLSSKPVQQSMPPTLNNKEFPPLPKRRFPQSQQNMYTSNTSSTTEDLKSILNIFKNINLQQILKKLSEVSQKLGQCNDTWSKIIILIESVLTFSTADGCTP